MKYLEPIIGKESLDGTPITPAMRGVARQRAIDTQAPRFPHIHLRCRVKDIDELDIEWDYPEDKHGRAIEHKPKIPVGGVHAKHGFFARTLLTTGKGFIPTKWGYAPSGRSIVKEKIDVVAQGIMSLPWQEAMTVLLAYPELFEEVDQAPQRRVVAPQPETKEEAPEPGFMALAEDTPTKPKGKAKK
jgi:hypothetical protein